MAADSKRFIRCAIYTRKSSEEGLEQAFNSLDAQREACVAYVESQKHEGWRAIDTLYDDGGFSGGTLNRPAMTKLLADIASGLIDIVVVYKVDRLTRSLADFAKIVESLDAQGISFVSVTQQFNTTSSMGRLTLNVLLSFAQFEREVTGERIRDKIAASKRRGIWMGGMVPLGYDLGERKLRINPIEAKLVNHLYHRYLALKSVSLLRTEAITEGLTNKTRISAVGDARGGKVFSRGALYAILKNRLYIGETTHKDKSYPGEHEAIVPRALWDEVQATLASNRHDRKSGATAQESSLLAGLLYDDKGNRLTPLHTKRRNKRYRYYVSQALIQQRPDKAGKVTRIPAHEIEGLVIQRISQFLGLSHTLLDELGIASDDTTTKKALIDAATRQVSSLTDTDNQAQRQFLLQIMYRIIIHEHDIELQISSRRLRALLLGELAAADFMQATQKNDHPEDLLNLKIDATLNKIGGEVHLIVAGPASMDQAPRPNESLIIAIARAHHWYQQLMTGEEKSMRSIAENTGFKECYISRLLKLAFLAPDIIERILEGRQPPGLSLERLLKDMPYDWISQKEVFCIHTRPLL